MSEKTTASRTVGKQKKATVINAISGERIYPPSNIISVCRITSRIPACRTLPLTIRNMAIDAEMHEVPLVANELINPSFFRFIKKRTVIIMKKKAER